MNALNDRLAAAADEMQGTDYTALRARVHARSRQLGRRRAVGASMAALAAVGVVLVGITQLAPTDRPARLPAGPVAVPAQPSTPPAPAQDGGADLTVTGRPPGTLVYLRSEPGQMLEVITVSGGQLHRTAFGVAGEEYAKIVSPDTTKIAVVTFPNTTSAGDLVVISPGGARRTVATNVRWTSGDWPVWMPGSTSIAAKIGDEWQLVDINGGPARPAGIAADAGYLAWSGNGAYRAFHSAERIVVTRADGTVVSRTAAPDTAECRDLGCPTSVQAVSDDGRYVALGRRNTDPSHVAEAHVVLDTSTGGTVRTPAVAGDLDRIYFRPGGGLLLRSADTAGTGTGTETVSAVDATGTVTVTATIRQPTDRPSAELVGYRP